ncbi:hypothetical protein FKM82_015100 [Ascaphus truei]
MLCYSCQLVGGILAQKDGKKQESAKSLLIIASQLSHCRTVLRLFDDLAMFAYSKQYGLGRKEGLILSFLELCYTIQCVNGDSAFNPFTARRGLRRIATPLAAKGSTNRMKSFFCRGEGPLSRGQIKAQVRSEVLSIIGSLSDLANAVHWMPPGFLWGGQSPTWLVGLMGTGSSLISIYQTAVGGNTGGV